MANIKTLYGSDKLREAYPKVNENFNAVNGEVNDLRGRVNNIITTPIDGEAAAQELTDARGEHSTLGERLDEFDSHMADNVSQRLSKTRDLSLTGVETVTGLRKKPKRITVFAAVNSTQKVCIGTYVVNDNAHATIVLHPSGNYYSLGNIIIRVYDTANDFTNATIQNVTDSQFEINWAHTGAGATGTLTYHIVIDY